MQNTWKNLVNKAVKIKRPKTQLPSDLKSIFAEYGPKANITIYISE